MLKTLNIENIAVIEKAEIEFSDGLNVLTGETGAGKSIVVDSINAILGERTSRELVRNGADYAFVSAFFDNAADNVIDKIKSFGFDADAEDGVLVTRKITANGKSVCKINGNSVTVSMLKEVGQLLVNIHGQHDSQALLNPDKHFEFIDMMCSDKSILQSYKECFHSLITVRRKLKAVTVDEESKDKELELLDYQIKELSDAEITVGERAELLKKKAIIENSENILNALNNTLYFLNGDDENQGAVSLIGLGAKEVSAVNNNSELENISVRLYDMADNLEEIKDMISIQLSQLEFDEREREKVEERLDLLYRLSLKYGNTEEEMLAFLNNAEKKRNSILYNDEELEILTAQYDEYLEKAVELADKLSEERKKTAKEFEKAVKEQLEFLDMPKISFEVHFDKGNLTSNGYDKIEFLIATNAGESAKPLAKIASGGELSRIMLAIKSIIAYNDTIGTLIFDEIDTGVSGRASRKIGLRLKSVSNNAQVICVTHSAQIASVANEHYLIKKSVNNNRTYTSVNALDFEDRKKELARIMGGLEITDTLLKSAEELLLSEE